MSGPPFEDGAIALQRALMAESAANLGRLGRALEVALTRLRNASPANHEELEYACAEAVWFYFIQREACGLNDHAHAIDAYSIPPSVMAKVGARRAKPDEPLR